MSVLTLFPFGLLMAEETKAVLEQGQGLLSDCCSMTQLQQPCTGLSHLPHQATADTQRTGVCMFSNVEKSQLQPWLVWLSGRSAGLRTKGLLVPFPVTAHGWVAGTLEKQPHIDVSLSFSLRSSLSKPK